MQGWLLLIAKREKQEAAQKLEFNFLASRGDPKEVNKRIRELDK